MQRLNLPEYDFRITRDNNKLKIFDVFRKKFLVLTSEEWVRQNFLTWLVKEKQYPQSLISVESGLKYNTLQKRSDAIIFNRNAQPAILIEFKAPSVELDNDTIKQILSYNYSIKAPYLIITNGLQHYCLKMNKTEKRFDFLQEIPDFNKLIEDVASI